MLWIRVRSLLLVSSMAAVAVACGQSETLVSPTSTGAGISATAPVAASDGGLSLTASSDGAFQALAKGGKGGGGNPGGKDNDKDKDDKKDGESDPGRDRERERVKPILPGSVSGYVTAVSVSMLTVRDVIVHVDAATFIRHGNRRLSLADIRVGDHVQAKGRMDGTAFLASEIKVEDTGRDNDDVDGAKVSGAIAGMAGVCPALSFMVGTIAVVTDSLTRFDGVLCSALITGQAVEVKGTRQPDGSILATAVTLD